MQIEIDTVVCAKKRFKICNEDISANRLTKRRQLRKYQPNWDRERILYREQRDLMKVM